MKEGRICKWDNAKGLLIICVVIGHLSYGFASGSFVLSRLQLWIYSFHMPAFFYLSGMFSKKTVRERRWSRIAGYLLLFLTMKVLEYGSSVFAFGREHASFSLLYEDGVPWYAMAVCICLAVTVFVRGAKPVFVLAAAVAVSVLTGYKEQHSALLTLERTAVFYPFFYLGYLTEEEKAGAFFSRKGIRAAGAVVLILSAAAAVLFYPRLENWILIFRGRYTWKEIGISGPLPAGAGMRLLAYAVSLLTAGAVLAATPERFLKLLTPLGQSTLAVYALHDPLDRCILAPRFPVRGFIGSGHTAVKCLILSLAVTLFTSLPVFKRLFSLIMNLPGQIARQIKK